VRDFEYLTEQWDSKYSKISEDMLETEIKGLGNVLARELGIDIALLDSDGSRFFKSTYRNTPRIIKSRQ